ncbi:alpha/beta hydrolase [Marinomonas atlantica]|uniref:alpha/beta hydrolase n=1 Tax=Marinomonas atlantica TaxID=1806668 RepID=UPI000835A9A7|nr:dienelactone hydrolase family protein [Marinomonas atlantica]MCO4787370.1 dienelactone hydrolase family protein [Marinomonas atlantica]
MSEILEYITVDTAENPQYGVIWLHGLGADCHDFEGLVPQLELSGKAVRFVFPNAPIRPVTINGGMKMRAWYDILEMTLDRKVDMDNIYESAKQIEVIITELAEQGISSDKIVMAGFSQGGVIAYQVALFGQHRFAGVMALSTYLADPEVIENAVSNANQETPFLIHHGSYDPVVAPVLADRAKQKLDDLGYHCEHKVYEMPHAVCPDQVRDIASWLNQRFT